MYRMHSKVNEYISNAIYQGQLKSDADNDKQIVQVPADYIGALNQEAGVIFISVEHQGNTQASDEEVAEIKKMVGGSVWVSAGGASLGGCVALDDVVEGI